MGMEAPMILSSSYAEANAARSAGNYAEQNAELNAKLAEMDAKDATRRGDDAANAARKRASQVRGAQRAAFAAQGIDVGQGTALDLQRETEVMGEQEAQMIKNNAWREAWGYQMEAQNQRTAGQFAQSSAQYRANNTVLTGGMRAINSGLRDAYQFSGGFTGGGSGGMRTGSPRPSAGSSYRDYSNMA